MRHLLVARSSVQMMALHGGRSLKTCRVATNIISLGRDYSDRGAGVYLFNAIMYSHHADFGTKSPVAKTQQMSV
jgi:hypothetical protein